MDIQSSFDFSKFESLKAMARQQPGQAGVGSEAINNAAFDGQKKALKKAAEQFEALFLQEMLKSMRASVGKDELVDSAAIQTYEEMFDREVALQMAKRGAVGISDMLVSHMEKQQQAAADMLARREREQSEQGFARNEKARAAMMPLEKTSSLGVPAQEQPAVAMPLDKPLKPLQREGAVARPLR
jgi:Rod binding domain-containing protein